jgi:catalase
MDDPTQAKRLVESIRADFPDSDRQKRPIHTIGIGVIGTFEPSEVARTYCIAEHFQPRPKNDPVKVTVRFSNGARNGDAFPPGGRARHRPDRDDARRLLRAQRR